MATAHDLARVVQDADERFEVASPARLLVAPLLEEGVEAIELVGWEPELAGDRVHLNAEEGKTSWGPRDYALLWVRPAGRTRYRAARAPRRTRVTREVPRPESRRGSGRRIARPGGAGTTPDRQRGH